VNYQYIPKFGVLGIHLYELVFVYLLNDFIARCEVQVLNG